MWVSVITCHLAARPPPLILMAVLFRTSDLRPFLSVFLPFPGADPRSKRLLQAPLIRLRFTTVAATEGNAVPVLSHEPPSLLVFLLHRDGVLLALHLNGSLLRPGLHLSAVQFHPQRPGRRLQRGVVKYGLLKLRVHLWREVLLLRVEVRQVVQWL